MKSIFRATASVRLSFYLLLLLTADLIVGYICLHGNSSFFEPMNHVGLRNWLTTYGMANPLLSGWFFVLLLLLFCLVVNTLVCTFDKLYQLFTTLGARISSNSFWLTITVHLMHLAMTMLLIGYLISYCFSTIHNSVTLLENPREATAVDEKLRMELSRIELILYTGDHDSFTGRYLDARAHLVLRHGNDCKSAVISINNPASFRGYSFFLQKFNPKYKSGTNMARYVVVDIRRDPGAGLTFAGMVLFIIALTGYLIFRTGIKPGRRNSICKD